MCDKLIFDHERTLFHLSNIEDDFLESMRTKLVFPPDLDKDLSDYYDVSSYSEKLKGIMLSKGGISLNDFGDVNLSICDTCKVSLKNTSNTPPKFAIANGLYIGVLPDEYYDTTKTEYALLNRAQSSAYIMTAIASLDFRWI